MKKIKSITIDKVKGIGHRTFDLELLPNKPSILVAPNGFGKSSLTAAFSHLNGNGIKLDKDTFYQNDETNKPKLAITIVNDDNSETIVIAEENSNSVKNEFDVFVINNLLIPKHKKQTFAGNTVVSSSIEVKPIILIDKIPAREIIEYSHSAIKTAFGANSKILPNILSLVNNTKLIADIVFSIDLAKCKGVRISEAVTKFKVDINLLSGTAEQILATGTATLLDDLKQKSFLSEVVALLDKHNSGLVSEIEKYLAVIQILDLYKTNEKKFLKTGEYYEYLNEKMAYEYRFTAFNATWKDIKPKEVNGSLIVDFPKANQISNGERDVITFVALLIRGRKKLKKQNGILLIDEVFDYLDDANLITAQYYITQMIAEFKRDGRKLFPLILTHLNPYYFKNFCFKDQKIYYLNKGVAHINRDIEKVILHRENSLIKSNLDCYFLHHNTNNVDLQADFTTLSLSAPLSKSADFKTAIGAEMVKYLDNRTTYDPISVCLAIRLKVEEKAFILLSTQDDRNEFISTHKTVNKLNLAEEKGVEIPDIF